MPPWAKGCSDNGHCCQTDDEGNEIVSSCEESTCVTEDVTPPPDDKVSLKNLLCPTVPVSVANPQANDMCRCSYSPPVPQKGRGL